MSNNNSDAILRLDADAYSLATTVGAKSMLCKFSKWENTVPAAENRKERRVIVGHSVKRVSLWHEKVLMPMTFTLVCNLYRNPPSFAQQVLQEDKLRQIEGTRNNIFELNVQLLVAASESLVSCLRNGLGNSTKKQISGWFQLMARIRVLPDPNNLTGKTSVGTQVSFIGVLNEYRTELRRLDGAGGQERSATEYMYFDHKILFLHIAHIVLFTCVETKSKMPSVNKCQMKVSNSRFEEWEQLSGDLSNRRLKLSNNGLLVDGENGADHTFTKIVIQRNWFRNQTKAGPPSVHRMHLSLIHNMHGKIHEMLTGRNIGSHEMFQANKLERFLINTTSAIQISEGVLKKNEKFRRHFIRTGIKKKGPSYQYKSRDPNKFERDEFIFGKHSFHYLFSTGAGQAYREMISCKTEDTVEVVLPEPDLYLFTRNGIIDGMMKDGLEDEV